MRKFTTAIVVGAASLTLFLAGCSGGDAKPAAGGAAAGAGATTLKMEDIKWDKTALTATKGTALTISLTNAGALDHDFTIEKIDAKATIDGKDAKTDKYAVQAPVKTKGSGKLEITPNATGTFEYFCSVPGHKEAGMKGTLTVN